MKLSVIIPVFNGGEGLRRGLEALAASSRPPDEVIVVDDGSTDTSGTLAAGLGARVISLADGPRGPARARNLGAAAATGDLLIFLDADVVVHPATLAGMEEYLSAHPEVSALFGSYDEGPEAPGLVSRYKNLLHHYVHQHSRPEASTFWTGCGAIRRRIFAALGGFDESQRMLEDIELGLRLREAGHLIRLCPWIQVTHLKSWTFSGLLQADIRDRAIPWTRLILRQKRLPADLNLDVRGRLGALAAWAALLFFVLGFYSAPAWLGLFAAAAALLALNHDLYRFFARHGSPGFTAGAIGLHTLYLLYSSLTFVLVAGRERFRRRWSKR